jgi:hypothetical protein
MKIYPTKANIGCGVDYREGWFNVDVIYDSIEWELVKPLQANLDELRNRNENP